MKLQRICLRTVFDLVRHRLCAFFFSVWVMLLLLSPVTSAHALAQTAQTSRPLSTQWEFRLVPDDVNAAAHLDLTEWRKASVPGSVHTDLLAAGRIPDPYAQSNEASLQWIGLARWEYRCAFDLPALMHHELVFDGIDTFADIYINDEKVLSTDNAFRTWRIALNREIFAKFKEKNNLLRVILHSPIQQMLPQVLAMPFKLAGNYPSPYGDEPVDAMTGNFVRKPSYHYGWDWGPRFVTLGLWRAVHLEGYSSLRLHGLEARQNSLSAARAELLAQVDVQVERTQKVQVELDVIDPDGRLLQTQRHHEILKSGRQQLQYSLKIAQPRLWYPNGYGAPALYKVLSRIVAGHQVLAQAEQKIGLRTVQLRRNVDLVDGVEGQEFTFVVNGIPVFAKGANLIPFDMFPNRVDDSQIRQVLQSAKAVHMNMLRVWGGGYYERDAFYTMADEMGLMIWQDFMFGGGVVPAYDARFRANVLQEASEQVQRLRSHPSVVLWCGNNEEETAWKDWGIAKNLRAQDPQFAEQVWRGYVQLFGQDLRRIVEENGHGAAYWSSSPSNDLDERANDSLRGDKHYWDVWAGSKPVQDYLKETPRFMSEYGLQSWPQMSTVDAFSRREQQTVNDAVIRQHQKFLAGAGNERLLHYIRAEYGEPQDFEDFVYLSQVMQAEGIALAAGHHRASKPRTMGSLYWQLNDVWPGASWSSIDYFGNWKALHFQAKRFFAPVAILASRVGLSAGGQTRVHAVSDLQTEQHLTWRRRLLHIEGSQVQESTQSIVLLPNSSMPLLDLSDAELLGERDPSQYVAVFELLEGEKTLSRSLVYFAAAKEIRWLNQRNQENQEIQVDIKPIGEKHQQQYQIQLSSKYFVRALWLSFEALPAQMSVQFSDNSLNLLPNEKVIVTLKIASGKLAQKDILVQLRKALRMQMLERRTEH